MENLDLGHWYRPHCVQSLLKNSIKILPYKLPTWLIRTNYYREGGLYGRILTEVVGTIPENVNYAFFFMYSASIIENFPA